MTYMLNLVLIALLCSGFESHQTCISMFGFIIIIYYNKFAAYQAKLQFIFSFTYLSYGLSTFISV